MCRAVQYRNGVGRRHGPRNQGARRQWSPAVAPREPAAQPASERQGREADHQIRPEIEGPQHLQGDQEAQPDPIDRPTAVECGQQGEHRERHQEEPLHFQVAVRREAIRCEGEQQARHQTGCRPTREGSQEREHADPGQHEGRNEDRAVCDRERNADPEQRCGQQPRQERRIGIGEGIGRGIKDVGVEQVPRARRQSVRNPAQPPHRKERIAAVGDGAENQRLAPQQPERGGQEQGHREEPLAPRRTGKPAARSVSRSGEPPGDEPFAKRRVPDGDVAQEPDGGSNGEQSRRVVGRQPGPSGPQPEPSGQVHEECQSQEQEEEGVGGPGDPNLVHRAQSEHTDWRREFEDADTSDKTVTPWPGRGGNFRAIFGSSRRR